MKRETIDKIYDLILETDPDCIEMNHLINAEIAKVLESYSGTLEKDELEGLSDQFVDVVSAATNEAYQIGASHCLKLIIETLNS